MLNSFENQFKNWFEQQGKEIERKNFEITKKNFLKNLTQSPKKKAIFKKIRSVRSSKLNSFNSVESITSLMKQQYYSQGDLVQLKWSDNIFKKPVM